MIKTYGEEWYGFQFRSPVYLDGHFEPYEFDLVKWVYRKPSETDNGVSTRYCYSVGTLVWNKKDCNFSFKSVGLRYLRDRIDGLEEWILDFCEEMSKELGDGEDS